MTIRQYAPEITITVSVNGGQGKATVNIPSGPSGWNAWSSESVRYWTEKIHDAISSARSAADKEQR